MKKLIDALLAFLSCRLSFLAKRTLMLGSHSLFILLLQLLGDNKRGIIFFITANPLRVPAFTRRPLQFSSHGRDK